MVFLETYSWQSHIKRPILCNFSKDPVSGCNLSSCLDYHTGFIIATIVNFLVPYNYTGSITATVIWFFEYYTTTVVLSLQQLYIFWVPYNNTVFTTGTVNEFVSAIQPQWFYHYNS